MKPQKIDDATFAFPARVSHLMPQMKEIPQEFKNFPGNKWVKFQGHWFFKGLKNPQFYPKEGIDAETAYRHLAAIQGSFEPQHEHKAAAVAYLASQWFSNVEYDET